MAASLNQFLCMDPFAALGAAPEFINTARACCFVRKELVVEFIKLPRVLKPLVLSCSSHFFCIRMWNRKFWKIGIFSINSGCFAAGIRLLFLSNIFCLIFNFQKHLILNLMKVAEAGITY